MKIKKSHLKELIRQSIKSIVSEEDVMDKKIKYKTDDGEEKEATIGGILKQGEDHPAHDKAQAMVDKGGEKKPTKTELETLAILQKLMQKNILEILKTQK